MYFVTNLLTAEPSAILRKECVESIIITISFTKKDHNLKF